MRARLLAALVAASVPATAVAADRPGKLSDTASIVIAQSGPVRLIPRERVEPPPKVESEQPPSADVPEGQLPGSAPRRTIQNIEVNPLQGPDPDEAGPLYADNGGFGNALWDGMTRDLILRLVRRLPAGMPSPAMRDVVRRMLLTAAVLPPRTGEDSASLIAARADRLQAMGLIGSAGDLIAVAPNRDTDGVLRRLRAENALIRGDLGGACAEAGRQNPRLGEIFWQKLLIYCQAVQGDTAGASLGANLLAETGQLDDPAFFKLVDRLVSGNTVTVETLPQPSPLIVSMMRTANVPVPADAIEQATPPLLGMIGASPNAPGEIRLQAAERAAQIGAMTADRLAEVYASVDFSREDLDNALSIAEVTRTPRGRALLYQAALVHSVPTARAAVIQKGLALARDDSRYGLIARVYESMLTGLAPSGELVWFAADAVRALYVLGRLEQAREWLDELRRQAARDPELATAARKLWAIATLAETSTAQPGIVGAPTPVAPGQNVAVARAAPLSPPADSGTAAAEGERRAELADIMAWRDALQKSAPETAAGHVADALLLLSATGVAVGDDAWHLTMGETGRRTTVSPDPGYRAMLSRAAGQARRGETLLLAALIVGEAGVSELDMTAAAEIVAALHQIGLTRDARKFAVEIAVRSGL